MAPPRNPGRPGRRPPGPSASTPKARPAPPKAPARPAWDDPNAYRSPGFQDQPQTAYRVDYAGLPRDVEDEAPEGNTPVATPGPASGRPHAGPPRGMYGRRPDRAGTDPNAYRSPGYAGPQRGGSRPLTAAERLAAIGQATQPPSAESSEAEPEVDDSEAALLGGPRRA